MGYLDILNFFANLPQNILDVFFATLQTLSITLVKLIYSIYLSVETITYVLFWMPEWTLFQWAVITYYVFLVSFLLRITFYKQSFIFIKIIIYNSSTSKLRKILHLFLFFFLYTNPKKKIKKLSIKSNKSIYYKFKRK